MKYCNSAAEKHIHIGKKTLKANMQGTFVHKESQVRVLKSEQRIKVVRTLLAAYMI